MIGRHAQRLNLIFDDLLSLSRLEQGSERGFLERREQKLRPLLEACVELCEQRAQVKNVTVSLEAEETISALVNASLVQQAVVNLVDNAIKFSGSGGNVRVVVVQDEQGVHLQVHDSGPGISPQHLGRIFERFYRVDQARDRREGGTGLGLAIVKHIAQAHGGTVAASSELGKGSCFEVILPALTLH